MAPRIRSTSVLRGATQASTAPAPAGAIADHRGGKPPLGIADGIARPIERQPIEIIRDRDGASRSRDEIEPEERAGGEVGSRNFADRLAGAVGDQDDVGRRRERTKIGDTGGEVRRARPASVSSCLRAARAAQRLVGQRMIESGRDCGDAVTIMRHEIGKPFGQINIAQKPDDAVEQQVLYRRVEIELQFPVNPIVERVDRGVERGHAVAVAHRGKG